MSDLNLTNSTYQTGTIDTATTLVDNVDTVQAQHQNGPNSAIIQIETILGNGPGLKGNLADLNTRLNVQMDTNGNLCPVGSMLMFGGSAAPTGWLFCDGSAVNRTTYATLFGVIGTTYGVGDGVTTFNVPDMRGRIPLGVGTGTGGGASGTGLPTGGGALTAVARGTWKGEETHALTTAELATHNHVLTDPGHTHASDNSLDNTAPHSGSFLGNNGSGSTGFNVVSATTGITLASTGSGTAHNNIQPVMGLNFIIRT